MNITANVMNMVKGHSIGYSYPSSIIQVKGNIGVDKGSKIGTQTCYGDIIHRYMYVDVYIITCLCPSLLSFYAILEWLRTQSVYFSLYEGDEGEILQRDRSISPDVNSINKILNKALQIILGPL